MKPIKNVRQAFPMFFSVAVRNHANELFQIVFCSDTSTTLTLANMHEFLRVSRLESNMVGNSVEKMGMPLTQAKAVVKFIKSRHFEDWRVKQVPVVSCLNWQSVEVYAIHTRIVNVSPGTPDSYFN